MKSSSSSPFLTQLTSFARPFIAVLFSLCFFSPLSSVIARASDPYVEAIADICDSINNYISFINDDVVRIRQEMDGTAYVNNSANAVSYHHLLQEILSKMGSGTEDVLASNPWWATNSAFTTSLVNYPYAFPDDGSSATGRYSFPQFLSLWSSRLSMRSETHSSITSALSHWWDLWGANDYNALTSADERRRRGYTWFDWVTDAFRSNWTASSFTSYYQLTNEISRPVFPDEDEENPSPTNAPLPEYRNFRSDFQHAIANPPNFSSAVQFDVDLQSPTDGDPAFVVIPSLTAGGVSLSASVFSFADLPPYVRSMVPAVMAWLWRVLFVVALWHLVKVEFGFWSTLGNSEGGA